MELKDDPYNSASDFKYETPDFVSNEPSRQYPGMDVSSPIQMYRAPVRDDFDLKSVMAQPGTVEAKPLELVGPRSQSEIGALASTLLSSDFQTKGKSDRDVGFKAEEKSEDPVTSTNNNETKTEPNRNTMTVQSSPAPATTLPVPETPTVLPLLTPAAPLPLSSLAQAAPLPMSSLAQTASLQTSTPTIPLQMQTAPSHTLPISIPATLPIMTPPPKVAVPTQAAMIPQPTATTSQASTAAPTASSQYSTTTPAATSSVPAPNNVSSKKGQLWALPIVPKLPQKPPEKRPNSLSGLGKKSETSPAENVSPVPASAVAASSSSAASAAAASASSTAPLADVWRQAFGAKPKKAENPGNGKSGKVDQQQPQGADGPVVKKCEKTYLDIPPEVRRRPKPVFGGLIHFSPDWERAVFHHHDRCRLPASLSKKMQVHPQILTG